MKKVLLIAVSLMSFSSVALAADSPCVLNKVGTGESSQQFVATSTGFLAANLEGVSAEVYTFGINASPSQYIERMTLTDSKTGTSVLFRHDVVCIIQPNICRTEENVNMQIGRLSLNLGARGEFELSCDVRSL